MKKSAFRQMLNDEYDVITEDERITQIDTMTKVNYSPLDMRDDEISFNELAELCSEPTVGFRGKYAFLSNMAYSPFEMNGHWFLTAEHAFHFWKCKYADDAWKFDASNPNCVKNPYEARKLGRSIVMRDGWNDIRLRVMEAIVHAKFSQNEYLMDKLAEIRGEICEYNDWGDTFWGKSKVNGKWVGENHLGKILTKLVDEYQTEEWLEEADIQICF